ncbi:type I polyketide synthase [Micromonospora sp. WMMD718]|uniref:type I polyketide synthase n=1 Tax=unclassified Micromonospora TaxID=2617518 RepID=UPI00069E60A7|nr:MULTISPECIES: type I polyketide synthase [unclassified Micromonospora]MDG4752604.1 type I polyketide synthase [Micromonospora sp. WMMD718]
MTAPDTSAATLKRALAAIDQLQRDLAAARDQRAEPIAVVGLGCRFPGGVVDADSYWRLLADGVDAIQDIPPDRWNVDAFYQSEVGHPGTMTTRWGGFLDRIDEFDAAFFGISPLEAEAMDPNQRLVLEVAWEALEHAGHARMAGSRTGVFVGVLGSDYALRNFRRPDEVTPYVLTGNAHSIVSGRLAYLLDLRGPAVSVDTACSSSLVSVHLACQSLRSGECDTALAGGVNVMLSPLPTIGFSQFGMMAPDGRCRTFDAAANGFVRGEGCGMVVLKRLSDALAADDDVLAVIRGGAMNQDGRSTGLTAPNVMSQRDLLRRALDAAGVRPEQVSYVEAHGTATTLGDPIEAEALAEVYPAEPGAEWHLGSVKTNFGHLEAAAGVAGLIKVILALRHRAIPAHLHFERLSPLIGLDRPPFTVPTRLTEWAPRDGRRIAGVSSFGLSGTNVHLLVEEGPQRQPVEADDRRPLSVLALSARSEEGLRALVSRHREVLAAAPARLADHCWSANTGRMHFAHRLAVVAGTAEEVDAALAAATEQPAPAAARDPEVTFLFSGDGAGSPGMARTLYETSPVFREAIERCDELLPDPLLPVLFPARPDAADLRRPARSQPALFAVEYALAQLWRSWGVEPAAVLGRGVGEVAAACTAGVLKLEGALRLVTERARLAEAGAAGLDAFHRAVAEIGQAPPRIPFVSSLTGELQPWDRAPGAEHWSGLAGGPERFAEGVAELRGLGHHRFLGIGPDTTMLDDLDGDLLRLPSLRPGTDDWETMLGALAELYRQGTDVDWLGFDRGYRRTRVPVPTTPFVRTRHWYESASETDLPAPGPGSAAAPASAGEPLLTREALLALPPAERFDVLADHLARGVGAALSSGSAARRKAAGAAVQVGLDQPFLELGMDSLMAMGLRNQIRTRFGVTLPIAGLLQGASVRRLADRILALLDETDPPPAADGPAADAPAADGPATDAPAADDPTDALLAELERLPADERQALLAEGNDR